MSNTATIPLHAWLIMGIALFAVSSAGAVFEMIEGVAGLSKAAWRLQATSLVLLPGFIFQYAKAEDSLKSQWRGSMLVGCIWNLFSLALWCMADVIG